MKQLVLCSVFYPNSGGPTGHTPVSFFKGTWVAISNSTKIPSVGLKGHILYIVHVIPIIKLHKNVART